MVKLGRKELIKSGSKGLNLRKLRRIALRKTDNMIDAVITYENMLDDLKKGFKKRF